MNSAKKILRNNTVSLLIIQIMNYVIPLITLPYLSRIFTVDKFGLIFYAQATIDYFARFIMFGFELSGVRTIAINRDHPEKINQIFNSIFCAQFILFFISFIILAGILFFVPKFREDYLVYLLVFIPLIGSVLSSTWFYQGMERMKFITVLNIIGQSIGVILTFLFIKKPDDYYLWLSLWVIIAFITGFISIFFIKKYFNIKYAIAPIKEIWESLKYSSQFFMTKVSVYLYRQLNVVILGFVCSSVAVAYYVAADKLFIAVLSLYHTFIVAFLPYMSKNKDIVFFKKILKYLILFCILSTIGIFFLAKPVIYLVYSDKYLEAVNILQIFSFSFIFNVLVGTFGFSFLGAYGYIKETNSCYMLGALYNRLGLLTLYLLNKINIYNVAILASSTYVIMIIHRLYYIWKYKLLK